MGLFLSFLFFYDKHRAVHGMLDSYTHQEGKLLLAFKLEHGFGIYPHASN